MADKKYIVIFKEDATQAQIDKCADEVTRSGGGKVEHKYDSIMKGFSATLSENYVSGLQNNLVDNGIEYIEEDSVVNANIAVN